MYYRVSRTAHVYATVWRPKIVYGNSVYELLHVTQLPASSTGVKRVLLPAGIPVRNGDFIGIMYDSNLSVEQTSYCDHLDDGCDSGAIYTTYVMNRFADQVTIGLQVYHSETVRTVYEGYPIKALINGNTPGIVYLIKFITSLGARRGGGGGGG